MLSAKEAAKQTKAAKKPNTEYLATLSKVEKLIDEQLKYATPTGSTHIPADH